MQIAPLLLVALTCFVRFSEPRFPTRSSCAGCEHHIRAAQHTPACNYDAPIFTSEQLYSFVKRFHDSFIYPNNLKEALKINSSLIAPDCLGNVDITRQFAGAELNTEYIFGSFGTVGATQSLNLLGVPITWNMTHFTGYQNVASFAATFQFFIPVLNITLPLEIWSWMSFNANGQVNQYDATFRYIEYYIQTILMLGMPALNASTPQDAATKLSYFLIKNICTTAVHSCNGTNTQYADYNSCVQYLSTNIPFGQAYQAGRNTLLCRMIHTPMVVFRPSVHCPHIGPSGGGMCVDDFTYQEKVEGSFAYFTNAPWLPRFSFSEVATGGPLPTKTGT